MVRSPSGRYLWYSLSNAVVRFDTATNTFWQTSYFATLADAAYQGVRQMTATDNGSAWVLARLWNGTMDAWQVQPDPCSNNWMDACAWEEPRIVDISFHAVDLAFDPASNLLWVAHAATNVVSAYDVSDHRSVEGPPKFSIPMPGEPAHLLKIPGAVLVSLKSGSVQRIVDGTSTALPVPHSGGQNALAWDGAHVWLASSNSVSEINPVTGFEYWTTTYKNPFELAVGPTNVYVERQAGAGAADINASMQIARINRSTHAVTATFSLPADANHQLIYGMAIADGDVWTLGLDKTSGTWKRALVRHEAS